MTAVMLSFPVMNMVIALGVGTGTGLGTVISRALGEKKRETVDAAAENAIWIYSIYGLCFMAFAIFGAEAFIRTQTDNSAVIGEAVTYLKIVSFFSCITMYQIMFGKFFQSTGYAFYSMITQASGALVNIILDPILIFGGGGIPAMGVKGAALATVIGKITALGISCRFHVRKNEEIHIDIRKITQPNKVIIKKIYDVGIPSIIMMSIGSVMTYLMNLILLSFSVTATAFFGIYFRLQSIVFMPIFGMNNGLIPIISYNYGSQRKDRILEALKKSMLFAVSTMALGMALFWIMPEKLLDLFHASSQMKAFGIRALRVISLSFPLAAVGITTGAVNQALSKSVYSLVISVVRQLVVLIPVAYLLSLRRDIGLIWWAFPIAELASFLLSILFFRKIYRDKIAVMQ